MNHRGDEAAWRVCRLPTTYHNSQPVSARCSVSTQSSVNPHFSDGQKHPPIRSIHHCEHVQTALSSVFTILKRSITSVMSSGSAAVRDAARVQHKTRCCLFFAWEASHSWHTPGSPLCVSVCVWGTERDTPLRSVVCVKRGRRRLF